MNLNAANEETMAQTGPRHEEQPSTLKDAQSLLREVQGLAYEHFHLAALETQRAGESLVTMMVLGVLLAVLLIGAWLGLCAATVVILVGQGFSASSAILLAVVFSLLAALACLGVIRRKSVFLRFPATLNSLQPAHKKATKP